MKYLVLNHDMTKAAQIYIEWVCVQGRVTTCVAGQNGLPVAKLVHYGPVEDCVAYISRRVKENRSGIATANYERQMLGKELRSRLKGNRNN